MRCRGPQVKRLTKLQVHRCDYRRQVLTLILLILWIPLFVVLKYELPTTVNVSRSFRQSKTYVALCGINMYWCFDSCLQNSSGCKANSSSSKSCTVDSTTESARHLRQVRWVGLACTVVLRVKGHQYQRKKHDFERLRLCQLTSRSLIAARRSECTPSGGTSLYRLPCKPTKRTSKQASKTKNKHSNEGTNEPTHKRTNERNTQTHTSTCGAEQWKHKRSKEVGRGAAGRNKKQKKMSATSAAAAVGGCKGTNASDRMWYYGPNIVLHILLHLMIRYYSTPGIFITTRSIYTGIC